MEPMRDPSDAQRRTSPTFVLGAAVVLFYLLFYFLPLGARPLIIPDEPRYAEIPREMLSSGDWVVPHLNGLRYFEKPPLGYWANAVSMTVFGENPFAVRLPSALAAGLTALLVFLFSGRVGANRRTALLAALIYLTFVEVYFVGTFAVLDNLLTLFLTAGIMAFYMAAGGTGPGEGRRYWLLAGVAFGLAFLTKGFLAFAVPVMVLGGWMLWQGQWRMLLTKSWLVLLAALVTALPWAVLIHLREADFWHYFFWIEHIQRFFADSAQHKAPFYYFLMYLPALAFPWIALAPAALAGLRRAAGERRERPAIRLLWLWLLLPFLFFSASSGKLATYILPCFPPLAILTALGLSRYLAQRQRRLFNFGVVINAAMFLGLLATLLISQGLDVGFRGYGAGDGVRVAALAGVLALGVVSWLSALGGRRPAVLLLGGAVATIPLMLISHLAVPSRLLEQGAPSLLLDQHRDQVSADTILVCDGELVRAVTWYFKRDDIYLISRHELTYGLGYADAAHRFVDKQGFAALLDSNAGRRPVVVICERSCDGGVEELLPPNALKYDWGKFVSWHIPRNTHDVSNQ